MRAILRVGKIIVGVTTDYIRSTSRGEKRPSAPIVRASAGQLRKHFVFGQSMLRGPARGGADGAHLRVICGYSRAPAESRNETTAAWPLRRAITSGVRHSMKAPR